MGTRNTQSQNKRNVRKGPDDLVTKSVKISNSQNLRNTAEDLLNQQLRKLNPEHINGDTIKLIHELEVHQVELEMQNEELIRAQTIAQEAISKYSDLYDFAPAGYFTLSSTGSIVELNLNGAAMLGKERSYLVNTHFAFFISDATRPIFNTFFQKVFFGRTKESCEVTISINGQQPIVAYINGIAVDDGEKCILTAVDITAHRLAEEALRESDIRYRAISEFSNSAICIVDENAKIEWANNQMTAISGFSEKEILAADSFISFLAPESVDFVVPNFMKILAGEPYEHHYEFYFIHANGNKRLCEKYMTHYADRHGKIKLIINMTDITDRRQAVEELIKAKDQAEQSDLLKSAFLANMSHEIRTPMNGILGFADLLKEPGLTGEEQKRYIGIIEKSGERMLDIINNLINISKVESGQMEVFHSPTNVNEQMEFIYTFFYPEAERKGLQISMKTALPASEAIILTDREKVYAVLTNLVKNAIKFSLTGSIDMGYEKKDGFLEFFVKDTGVGILPEKQEIIFERFRQGSESLTRNYEGAGLGLAISKAYVEMLGGKIWVVSENDKGSVFYFTLPIQPNFK